jgi:hypothetical protein
MVQRNKNHVRLLFFGWVAMLKMGCHPLPSTGKAISFVTTATISACGRAGQWQLSLALLEDRMGKIVMKSKQVDLRRVTPKKKIEQ